MHNLPFTYMPMAAVCAATGQSKSKVYALIARGEFPAGDMISMQSRRWKSTDIAAWLEKTAAAAELNREALQEPLRRKAALAVNAKKEKRGGNHAAS